ncbi:MAG: hypothetical protein M3439_13685 [Chloroflexota bacterium]|nr:hypothetical protein [Chloroflexota bacterium]
MKKPRKERQSIPGKSAPTVTVLVELISNGPTLAVALRSEGLSPAAGA